MESAALAWWWLLCTVAAFNVLAWCAAVGLLRRRQVSMSDEAWAAARWQLLLSAGYVAGCAYRSAFPVFDVPRQVIVDSWLSSVIIGRSVATLAELCFAAQWALLLRGVGQATGSRSAVVVSRAIVPLIAVAEICSWYSVLTTSNLGHVIEESIWALCAALLVGSLVFLWPRCRREARPVIALVAVAGLVYVGYMAGVDVPRYWTRWLADLEQGRQYLSLAQGVADASGRWVVSHRWPDWQGEVVWMTLYFSVAVWLSIGLMHVQAARLGGHYDPTEPRAAGTRLEGRMPGATATMITMKSTTAFSFLRVMRAARYSEQGFRSAWRDEAAFRQELVCMALLAPLTLWLQLPRLDTVLLLVLMALVLGAELINSGVEAVVDIATPEYNALAAKAKDCGSAAVLVSLLALAGAWLALAGPVLWQRVVG
jgi:diacylglycerol kinase